MLNVILIILLLVGYVATSYFIFGLVKKHTTDSNKYLRMMCLSFVYALFWGIAIARNGGDPGFGFPAPNIVALGFMASIGFYRGIQEGLIILGFWWAVIFIVLFIQQVVKKRIT